MQLLIVWCIPTLTSIDHYNVSLSTVTPMLQHISLEVFDYSSQCKDNHIISDIGYLKILDI